MQVFTLLLCSALVSLTACQRPSNDASTTGAESVEQVLDREPDPQAALGQARESVEIARLGARTVEPLEPRLLRGVALPLYNEFPSLRYEDMLESIARVGASHVSIVVSWSQQTIRSNAIRPLDGDSPDPERVREVVEQAHELGLKVMLFPILHVERRNDGEWRGKLDPADPDVWREEYRRFIMAWAKLAAESNVELFSVGSELSSRENDAQFWRTLIRDVRREFAGELIYSSNWDHYTKPEFWDELDFIGISSYFEVAQSPSDPVHRVSDRWRKHRDEMSEFAQRVGKPLILTEVGYPTVQSAAVQPWNYTVKGPANSVAQLAAFRSLIDGWSGPPESFSGLFVWHGWGPGGKADTSYSIFDKPGESMLQKWFARPGQPGDPSGR